MPNTPEVWRSEFQANTTTTGPGGNVQEEPVIIQLTNGNIVVLWASNTDAGVASDIGFDIVGQMYDSRGNSIGDEFRANGVLLSNEDEHQFTAAPLDDGGFVVAFERITASGSSIQTTEWQTDENGVTNQISRLIQQDPTGINNGDVLSEPAVSANSNGSYLVAYEYENVSASSTNVEVVHVSSSGVVSSPVNAFTGSDSRSDNVEIARLSNSNHVVIGGFDSGGDSGISFRIFTASGTAVAPAGGPGIVDGTTSDGDGDIEATVIGLANGGFVVAWTDVDSGGGGDTDVQFQRFNNSGVAQGGSVHVNNGPGVDNANEPKLIALADGGFVVVYDDDIADTINGQRYSATGVEIGAEFTITNSGTEYDPAGIGLDDGRFVTGWTTSVGPGTNVEIEFYDPRDDENSPNVYSTDQVVGTVGADEIDISASDDEVYGWNGADRFIFNFASDVTAGDLFDGGGGADVLVHQGGHLSNMDLRTATLQSFSELEFQDGLGANNIDKTAHINASQIGAGLSSFALIDGWDTVGSDDTLNIYMGSETSLDLSNWTFEDWQTSSDNTDRLIVRGDNSNENITGTTRVDDLRGSGGNDIFNGLNGSDTINGGSGSDTASYEDATNNVSVYLEYTGIFVGGGQGADTLINIENLTGGDFNDRLVGDDGDNTLIGGDGNDILIGRDGSNTFSGGNGDDRLVGGSGSDIMSGGAGSDILYALAGNDILNGGGDRDFVYGGRDTDIVHGDGGDDEVRGNLGNDMLFGDSGIDDLRGGGNNDMLDGGIGDDFLFGENGQDTLIGGSGNDSLTGGMGAGVLDGLTDTFVYSDTASGAGGFDRINDWEDGIDLIDLTSFGFANFAAVQALASSANGGLDTRINFGGGDVLYVEDFALANFDASDVMLA